ncbi:MAG: hypothetical protein U5L96_20455 [Owenweeksia sp.]|nr:hypothetical protein [Owenweeksia sp.]
MKKLFTLVMALAACQLMAQKVKDDIVYFEDSRVRNSRLSLALVANPNFSDRNLLNDEINNGGGLDLSSTKAKGGIAFNYNLDVFFSLSSALDIGVGFGRAQAVWSISDAQLYASENFPLDIQDTLLVDASFSANMWTVPLKLNFNTTISDIFELEVIPTVSMNFIDSYEMDYTSQSAQNSRSGILDLTQLTRNTNWRVGISLGGTWYFTENWGFFVRVNGNYMLNSMIERSGYPRQTVYSVGSDIGLKVHL